MLGSEGKPASHLKRQVRVLSVTQFAVNMQVVVGYMPLYIPVYFIAYVCVCLF